LNTIQFFFFFFSSRRRHTRCLSDWSSDVCSSDLFHLNETEIDLIRALVPKRQFLLKTPEHAKVANLTVDRKSYWLYTNDPFDNRSEERRVGKECRSRMS